MVKEKLKELINAKQNTQIIHTKETEKKHYSLEIKLMY